MSTMRVTNLKHENSASNNIVLNSDGSVGGDLATTLASKLAAADQTFVQIVRATDTTLRTITSTSATDANLSVTITPNDTSHAILLVVSVLAGVETTSTAQLGRFVITDSSNNSISGQEDSRFGPLGDFGYQFRSPLVLTAYATPATTSAVTYKLRAYGSTGTTVTLENNTQTAEMYAIEVSP